MKDALRRIENTLTKKAVFLHFEFIGLLRKIVTSFSGATGGNF